MFVFVPSCKIYTSPHPLQIPSSVLTNFLPLYRLSPIPKNIPFPQLLQLQDWDLLLQRSISIDYVIQKGSHPPHLDFLEGCWLSANVCWMNAVPQTVTELLSKGSTPPHPLAQLALNFFGFLRQLTGLPASSHDGLYRQIPFSFMAQCWPAVLHYKQNFALTPCMTTFNQPVSVDPYLLLHLEQCRE